MIRPRRLWFLLLPIALASHGAAQPPAPPTLKIDQRQSGPFGDTIRAMSEALFQDERTKQESLETKK